MNIAREARLMLRAHSYGALSTLSQKFDGYPFGSIVPYLVDHDGSLLILISTLAEHTKNIGHDPRVSLITHDQRNPHIQTQGRVTLIGNARLEPNREQAGHRYMRYFPEAQTYIEMHDFSFYRICPVAIRYIGGFGKIHWIKMESYAVGQAEIFAQHEKALIEEMSLDQVDQLRKLMQQSHGIAMADVQVIGLDCDGMDVCCDEQILRLNFTDATISPLLDARILLEACQQK